MKIYLTLLLFFYTLNAFAQEIQIGCQVLNDKGILIRAFEGGMCAFFDDGSFISYSKNKLKKLDKDNHKVWEVDNILVHHRMVLSNDKRQLFALTKKVDKFLDQNLTIDVLQIFDTSNGKLLGTIDVSNDLITHSRSGIIFHDNINNSFYFKNRFSFGHSNSVFELENDNLTKLNESFKKGNLLVNVGDKDGFIYLADRNTFEILWIYKTNFPCCFHDLKINKDNMFTVYLNSYFGLKSKKPKTIIYNFNPLNNAKEEIIELNLKNKDFFQPRTGAFDINSNQDLLFSAFTESDGFMLIKADKNKNVLFNIKPYQNPKGVGLEFQEAKYIEAKSFLRNNQIEF